ncbi:taurine ABC transporter substrate-binding protein [Photobacterium gaetbulicola]|uniref:Taurine ABC transporter, periplasmic binding protein n=1 Tax=Photobacterium gaetbulicola Gung47 TaxID=658445 RepID=A0A0C5W506_9GAMM|nr:taurine ABC transporter substrate-binding protein [Photobacterium gaetbulicola]AJR06581.1 taurine ABC transporter, periplasmic binding protein [Photobacterium gaetbulicola Gung47]PSU13911.1 taurine ABC transporter substrate-binding protein [Photobacterium gaetbulicola]
MTRNTTFFGMKELALVGVMAATLSSPAMAAKEVTIGYQGMFNPMKYAIDQKLFEDATGYSIKWRKFDSGARAITAMASGAVDMTVAGSSPIASAASNGIDMELVWVMENIADAEALVVRKGSGISSPSDLKGKTLGVPFVSTTHFHMLFALEQFGLTEKDVKLVNMQPGAIVAAWQRGDIDGAFIWDPALGTIKQDGEVLITSKQLSAWGKPTFDGLIASKSFTQSHSGFVTEFLTVLAKTDEEYRSNKEGFSADHPIAVSVAKLTGGKASNVPEAMSLYEFPTVDDQLSCQWLGCEAQGGAVKALEATSQFLLQEKKISGLQPDYSVFVNPSYAAQIEL